MGRIKIILRIASALIIWAVLGSFCQGAELSIQASSSFNYVDGVRKLQVHVLLTNVSDREITIPTGNLGPIEHLAVEEQTLTFSFKYVPSKLRDGREVVESISSFLPVVLRKGESAVISHRSILGADSEAKTVIVKYTVDQPCAARYGFTASALTVVASTEPF